ncbi:PAS domain S-box protein [filamentous cyanobacterium CCP3]|nr:PAS domain S-box protein [filamentous cyanobacterium CCP3]
MLNYVRRLLSPTYVVEAVRDGKAALAAIGQQPPDLVLSDVMMPELGGFELLRQLRADPLTRELPIILLSARAGEEARLEGLTAGADDYLTKPFSARELLARVEATLKLAQLRQEIKIALQRSEERSRLAVQVAQLGTWRYNRRTNLVELDERMQDIWGQPAAQLPLHQLVEHIHPDDRERVASAVSAALEPGASGAYVIEYRIRRSDGTERWMAANGQAFFADRGGGVHRTMELLGTVHDITERKHTELLLAEQTRLLELIASGDSLDSCLTAICTTIARLNSHIRASFLLCDTECQPFPRSITPDLPLTFGATLDEAPIHALCTGRYGEAVYSGQPVTCADIASDDRWSPEWRELCLAHGVLACHSVPIVGVEGLPFASLMLCFDQARLPTPWEYQLADFGAQVASIAFERDRATLALRESETRFRQMTDAAPMMVWLSGLDQRCIYFNQSWLAFTGRTLEQEMGDGWAEGIHPDDSQHCLSIYTNAFNARTPFQMEYRLRHVSGEYRWIFDLGEPRFAPDGTFLGYIGSCFDVHDRKQAEAALRQRETELRLVTNAVPALIAFVDAEQRYRFNNQGYEDWFGQSAAELYGKPIWEVVGDDGYERIRPYVEQVLAGQQVTFERSVEFQNGRLHYLTATYVPRVNNRGEVEGFVALITDLSDRKQAEIALSQSEERYRYLVESIPQLVWTANPEGVIVDANQRWLTFTGLSLEQVRTEGWQMAVHPEDVPGLAQNWAIAQQQGTNYQAEGRMRRADGVYRWHLHQAIPMKDSQGQVIKWFGSATDIEDQKQLEHQRSQLLQQEKAARAAAEAASRTKDEFLAVVSHELRSPLNPILGWATLLQSGNLSEAKTKQALAVIERNAKLQTELIDDLLDVSRMLRGKLEINATTVNLAATIRAAIETVRLAAEAKSIQVDVHLDDQIGLVSGDATRLQQVVWNLLSNAVKFTPAGGQIRVRLARDDANQAEITVSDTGKGISPDFLPLIFDYFRQADSATTRQFGGLGLGLAIVRHLVELHGGTIRADSAGEGLGATFTVTLPTLTHQPAADRHARLNEPALDLHGSHILVVDDDADTRNFIVFLLEQVGATVSSAASARAALNALQQAQPQVLISDIGMPEVDGYMLMQQIRALPTERGGRIPAIALTAYAREADQEQALAAGFQRHIPKPVQPAALIQALVGVLQVRQGL